MENVVTQQKLTCNRSSTTIELDKLKHTSRNEKPFQTPPRAACPIPESGSDSLQDSIHSPRNRLAQNGMYRSNDQSLPLAKRVSNAISWLLNVIRAQTALRASSRFPPASFNQPFYSSTLRVQTLEERSGPLSSSSSSLRDFAAQRDSSPTAAMAQLHNPGDTLILEACRYFASAFHEHGKWKVVFWTRDRNLALQVGFALSVCHRLW